MLTYNSRLQSIFVGNSKGQEAEAAGHVTSTVKSREK